MQRGFLWRISRFGVSLAIFPSIALDSRTLRLSFTDTETFTHSEVRPNSMKLSLVVTTSGKWEGKEIPITLPQFVVGRDQKCNLRPSSPLISKRHCAFLTRGTQVFLRDFGSTNGTFVNDQRIEGERELENQDRLTIGPLNFVVRLETSTPVDKPTPMPPTKASTSSNEEEDAAALLLSLQEGTNPNSETAPGEGQDVAPGSTVMDIIPLQSTEDGAGKDKADEKKKKTGSGDTSTAAKAILEKYLRRPRT
jgi:pSer/pThr/pTyr-binding forkhead associated (FHA) protein